MSTRGKGGVRERREEGQDERRGQKAEKRGEQGSEREEHRRDEQRRREKIGREGERVRRHNLGTEWVGQNGSDRRVSSQGGGTEQEAREKNSMKQR